MSFGDNSKFSTTGVSTASIMDASKPATYQNYQDPRESPLYEFLGAPNHQTPVDAYGYRSRVNKTLTDAYNGRNALISDTIEGLILSDNEPQTLVFMPWVFTSEKHFKMNIIKFDRALPAPTPHEGTSRLISSSENTRTFTSQRYGIKHRMEADFASTAQGQAQHLRNLVQISQAVQVRAWVARRGAARCVYSRNSHCHRNWR